MVAKVNEINRVQSLLNRTAELSKNLTEEKKELLHSEFQKVSPLIWHFMKKILTLAEEYMFTDEEWDLVDGILGENAEHFNTQHPSRRIAIVILTKIAVEKS